MSEEIIAKVVKVQLVRFKERPDLKPKPESVMRVIQGVSTPGDMENAGLFTKAKRLRLELAYWAKNGFKMATAEVRKARLAVCHACEYFDAKGNLGLGECLALR